MMEMKLLLLALPLAATGAPESCRSRSTRSSFESFMSVSRVRPVAPELMLRRKSAREVVAARRDVALQM